MSFKRCVCGALIVLVHVGTETMELSCDHTPGPSPVITEWSPSRDPMQERGGEHYFDLGMFVRAPIAAATASGAPPTGWLENGSNFNSAMRARRRWSSGYGEHPADTPVIWYAASEAAKRP